MYAPLWCKSNFSFLEGASHPEEIVEEAHRLGLRSIAITDRDGVYGMVRAFVKARELGVQLLCGAQVTVASPGSELVASPVTIAGPHAEGRGPGWGADTDDLPPEVPVTGRRGRVRRAKPRQAAIALPGPDTSGLPRAASGTAALPLGPAPPARSELVLLAADRAGWANLTRLLTSGRRRCDKGEALVSWREICERAGGLVALWGGERSLLAAEAEPPPGLAGELKEAFGDRLLALIARHRRAEDVPREARTRVRAAAARIPHVASLEVLYHSRARRALQDVLTCIRHGTTLATAGRRIRGNDEHDLRTPHAFGKLYADDPGAIARSLEVAARCAFSLGELRYRYPSERLPDGSTSAEHLRALVAAGAAWRYGGVVGEDVRRQLEAELAVIEDLDYPGYFLTMYEIVSYCRRRNILCQGRGSAANSAVCYCLGITAIDPVKMGLLFERFLSRERAEPPDIDLDIEHERREEVIQHVYSVYGRDHAAMVCNVVRYRPRSAVRDVGKVLGIPETALDRAAKHLSMHGLVEREALEGAGLADHGAAALDHLARLADEILEFPRHISIHPGGFLLGHEPVHDIVPIENAAMTGRTVIQWDKDDLEDLGLFKVDLLALGALHQLHLAFDLIAAHRGRALTMATIPPEDPATYDMICTADTVGTFQIESRAQMSMLPRLRPRTFYDLVVEVSIVRPGPISGGMVHPYLRRRRGEEPVTYPHPCLQPVLEKTLGVPLFQEQVMRLAVVAADYTPGEADQLRRDMAAWRRSGRIEKHRERLISRMEAKGIGREFGERVFEQIRGFGEYGFPESHAASFALIAYATSWVRCHYPVEFTCSLLNAQPMGFYSPATIVGDAQRHGVEVRPIDVLHSAWDCTLEPVGDMSDRSGTTDALAYAVRMGLCWTRGLSRADAERLLEARRARPFQSLEDFVRRTRLPTRVHDTLAEAGALGGLCEPRAVLADGSAGPARFHAPQRRDVLWQLRGFIARQDDAMALGDPDAAVAFPPLSRLQEIVWDHASSEHSTRGHPLAPLRGELRANRWPDARTVARGRDGQRIEYVGVVICRQQPGTAGGVVFMTLEDETGFVNVVVWQRVFEEFSGVIRTTSLLGIAGKLQVQEGLVHLIAERVWAPALTRPVVSVESRDFH
ncbi:MAG TPA: error-prone DNA polymerase [Kofleriaceae bacterium]|nr:error-prone DNA polymerase [Kofleriaceae bacterium]